MPAGALPRNPFRPFLSGIDTLAARMHHAGMDDVLDLTEAARLLRVSPRTVRTRAKAGLIPGRKVGRDWRFNKEALLRHLEGRAPETVEEVVTRTVRRG